MMIGDLPESIEVKETENNIIITVDVPYGNERERIAIARIKTIQELLKKHEIPFQAECSQEDIQDIDTLII